MMLDRAATKGLPVPQGYIVLHEAWMHALESCVVELDRGVVQAPDVQQFLSTLSLPIWHGSLAVRSAFSSEDGVAESQAGFYQTRLWVDARDNRQLASALCEVWGSAHLDTQRRDVLVMQMVDAKVAGVAFTERDYEGDLVNYTAGTAEALVSGEVEGDSMTLPKRLPGLGGLASPLAPPWASRLQRLLRDVRRVFGRTSGTEWADDGVLVTKFGRDASNPA